ncbi:BNR-4 repeat-containing protein [Klebsiella pneumoniae]|nr:BNR-4 repeat-containing protein [Klebsiella pneumoniae]MDE4670918.1 BNR-4 repeat-containing protein [Klebsiella pneumoniae]
MLDKVVTSTELTYTDRLGGEHYTVDGIKAEGDKVVEETRQNLIPLSRQYMTLAAAQADIANIPEGSTTYVRSPDGGSLADEYINNGGTLTATGRKMPSQLTVGYLSDGLYSVNASDIWQITPNLVIFSGGETGTYSDYDAYFLPCEPGDIVSYFGVINTATASQVNAWLIQCDGNKNYVSDIATHISDGSGIGQGTVSGEATQTGYVYVRVKKSANPGWNIGFLEKRLVTTEDVGIAGGVAEYNTVKGIADNGETINYTGDSNFYTVGIVMLLNGGINTAAGTDWLAYYVPVKEGDEITMAGTYGSLQSGQQMAYFIQLDADKNFVKPLDIYVSEGSNDVQLTRSAVASQDGFMYVRVRRSLNNEAKPYSVTGFQRPYQLLQDVAKIRSDVDELMSGSTPIAGQTPFIGASLDLLPVKFGNMYNYNSAAFIQNNVVKAGGYIYICGNAQGQRPYVFKKSINGGAWSYFDLTNVDGNPLARPTADDSHNAYCMAVTKDGYIIISGNMHVNPCRAVISSNPHDITAWTAITYTDSEQVTYPRLTTTPAGKTRAFWREGNSQSGQYYSALFNDTTKAFDSKVKIIETDLTVNAYEQRIGIGLDNSIHMCWGNRVSSAAADGNYGLFYAKSADNGVTWTNAAGNITYTLPLSESNCEKIADVAINTGYVNQNGGAVDRDGCYHTCLWQNDSDGNIQIDHIWFDGSAWQREQVTSFNFSLDLSGGLLDGSMSRPLIACTRYGKTYVFYRTNKGGMEGQVRVIDVTAAGSPVEFILARFNYGFLELSLNTDIILNDNNVMMLATRGAIGTAQGNSRYFYTAESAYLMTAALP